MDQGVIAETGSYEQLMGHNGAFAKFMKTYLTEHNSDSDSDEEGTTLFRDLVINYFHIPRTGQNYISPYDA